MSDRVLRWPLAVVLDGAYAFPIRSPTRILLLLSAALAACDGLREAEEVDAGVDVPLVCDAPVPPEVTWSYLYATYFGPNTPGHCGNSGCHDPPLGHGGWICGATADSCYHGMLNRTIRNKPQPLIDLQDPPASLLIAPDSPLIWFDPKNGIMPQDNLVPNPCATRDIPRWLSPDGGAQEN